MPRLTAAPVGADRADSAGPNEAARLPQHRPPRRSPDPETPRRRARCRGSRRVHVAALRRREGNTSDSRHRSAPRRAGPTSGRRRTTSSTAPKLRCPWKGPRPCVRASGRREQEGERRREDRGATEGRSRKADAGLQGPLEPDESQRLQPPTMGGAASGRQIMPRSTPPLKSVEREAERRLLRHAPGLAQSMAESQLRSLNSRRRRPSTAWPPSEAGAA